ncbi:MAG: DUF4397 domain-containing protein [Terriglobales bacterium]|jgi:hypothetical protein
MKMSGWLKALPIALAVAALGIVSTSCNNGQAQIRMINAVPDSPALDIYINGAKIFPNLTFTEVVPDSSPATYFTTPSGNATIQGYPAGNDVTPTSPAGTVTFNRTWQYTIIAEGPENGDSPPLLLTDNNTAPVSGDVEFRVVNAASGSGAGVDVYIVPSDVTDLTNYTAQIRGLNNGQASDYQSITFAAIGYNLIVTLSGSRAPYITVPFTLASGSIRTVVLVDNVGGNNGMSQTPIVLNDLN